MNGAVARTPATDMTFAVSALVPLAVNRPSLFVSYAGPPMNVKAYRLAVKGEHTCAGEMLFVVKNTISPATAGKAVTFSSTPELSVRSSGIPAVFDPELP